MKNKEYSNKEIIQRILNKKSEYIEKEKLEKKENLNKLRKSRKKKFLVFIFLLIAIFLSFLIKSNLFNKKYKTDLSNKTYYLMVVENLKKNDYDSYKVKLKQNNNYSDNFILNIYYTDEAKAEADFDSRHIYSYGDVLKVNGKIKIPEELKNEGDFNYKKYLNSKNIIAVISSYNVEYVKTEKGNIFINYCLKLKNYFNKKIEENLQGETGELLKSILYGDKTTLDEDISNNFTKIGISHIIAVSGQHIVIIIYVISLLLDKLKLKKCYKNGIMIGAVIIFTFVASSELSLLRASIMYILSLPKKDNKNRIDIITRVLISLFAILLYNPYSITNIGMQLSYMATISISLFYNTISSNLQKIFKINSQKKGTLCYNLKNSIIASLSLTISVQILVLPLQLYYFNSLNLLFIISNLVISTFITFISGLGIVFLLTSFIPYLLVFLANSLYTLLTIVINLSAFFAKIDVLNFSIKSPDIMLILSYYSILIIITQKQKLFSYIYLLKNIKLKKNITKVLNFILNKIHIIIIVILTLSIIKEAFFNNYIYFFNIGQGDMGLLHIYNKNIIFDCGSTENNIADREMIAFLKHNNINNIDLIVISHFHKDHISGLEEILNKVKVEYIAFANISSNNTSILTEIENLMKEKNIKRLQVINSDKITIGKNIELDILSPFESNIIDKDKENANSIITKVTIRKFLKNKVLYITGDATINTEKLILKEIKQNEKVEILKVAHHGSKTSTSEEFLRKIKVKKAIISSKKSVYGHPHKEVLERLRLNKIKTMITENLGGIKITL